MNNKAWFTIAVRESTHKDLMLFKIKSKARNLDAVIKKALKLLKEQSR